MARKGRGFPVRPKQSRIPFESYSIVPVGIPSEEAFGTLLLTGPVNPDSIPSAEAFGDPILVGPIIATGIASGEAFGSPYLAFWVELDGIASEEAFGTIDFPPANTPTPGFVKMGR